MVKFYFLTLFGFLSFNIQAQYCMSAGPSSTDDSNVESVNLDGDVGNITFIGCPGVSGVQDLTNLSTTLNAGNSYSIDIQFGTCGGNWAGVGEAWIDYNNNQIFEATESIGTWTGTPPVALSTFNFSVPFGLTNGTTRMRIAQAESTSLPMDPCASFTWGSMMDFSIILTGGVDCSAYVGNTTADPIIVNSYPYTNSHNSSYCYTNDNNAYISPDVFYLILPDPQSTSLNVSLCGSSFDTFLSVFDTDGNTITFNDDGSCGGQSEVSFSTVDLDSAYVIVEGWGTESGDYEINIIETPLSVNEKTETNISIYPNPANASFTIKGLNNSQVTLQDLTGKVVQTISNYNETPIDIQHLNSGIYFVSFTLNGVTQVKKLTVK